MDDPRKEKTGLDTFLWGCENGSVNFLQESARCLRLLILEPNRREEEEIRFPSRVHVVDQVVLRVDCRGGAS